MLIPDPLEIGDVLCKMLALSNGSGISQRAAAARTQGPWRGLVCGPIGLGRYAQQDRVRVKPGETYRQPQERYYEEN